MEFWGVEVKAGEPLKVQPGEDMILHLSQASLGEVKKDKGNESVVLYVKIDGQKLVIGTLSADKCANISYDLVFEKEFELSHNWKNGSVYFCGYRSFVSDEPSGFSDSESDEEDDVPLKLTENGKPEPKGEESKPAAEKAVVAAKPDSAAKKQKAKPVEPSKDDDSDDEEDEDDSDEDESDDEDMLDAGDDSDDEDEDEDEDDESDDEEDEATPTPKKGNAGKKRPAAADSATKTPVEKKAKLVTPQKTGGDGKKGGGAHTATPHPSKQAGKTPAADGDKSKQQTPKSGGQFSCNACKKSFNTENGLQSHNKAKHSAGK